MIKKLFFVISLVLFRIDSFAATNQVLCAISSAELNQKLETLERSATVLTVSQPAVAAAAPGIAMYGQIGSYSSRTNIEFFICVTVKLK